MYGQRLLAFSEPDIKLMCKDENREAATLSPVRCRDLQDFVLKFHIGPETAFESVSLATIFH